MSEFIEGVFILLGLIFGLPLLLLIMFLVVAGVVGYPCAIYSRYRWKQKLRRQARLISKESILASAMSGTLIVDAPSCQTNVAYCWWTADKVHDLAPVKMQSRDEYLLYCKTHKVFPLDPFTEWCFEHYLHDEHGRALLVTTRRGDHLARWLLEQRPDLQIVWASSGFLELAKLEQEHQAAKAEQNKLGEAGT